MKKNDPKKTIRRGPSAGLDNLSAENDFYAGAPSEAPLYHQNSRHDHRRVSRTGRHQAVTGKRKENYDPRERAALLAILKSVITIMLLAIFFVILWKAIGLYEQKEWDAEQQISMLPLQSASLVSVEQFNIESDESRMQFAERIEKWGNAERLMRSADTLLKRNNYDLAIERCNEALKIDSGHLGALERLGLLYYSKQEYAASINAYVRALSVDPSRQDLQKMLIQSLDAYGDAKAVSFMANWYFEQNFYDADVQRHLAHALFQLEQYADSIEAYDRVLKDKPKDKEALEQKAAAYMEIGEYENALTCLEQLREINYRDQRYYKNIAICNAQLGNGEETVQTLGRAAHLFGQNIVVGWVQDPQMDPIRENRSFQAFADRVGGEEFRKWLEKVAKTMDEQSKEGVSPQLEVPDQDIGEMLKPNQ